MPGNPTSFAVISYKEIKDLVGQDPRFSSFRDMFRHEPLLRFVHAEKCRFPGSMPEDRVIYNPATEQEVGGYKCNTMMPEDEYSPGIFLPFTLKGIYLPVEEGTLFTTLSNIHDCPLIKTEEDGRNYILFFIHPKSETLYQGLLESYASSVRIFSALSLSSFRSLLVAVPKGQGNFEPVLVKISLDQSILGARRVLSRRECGLSVGNSVILSEKFKIDSIIRQLPLQIFQDPLSYLPKRHDFGMIYRVLPAFLNPQLADASGIYAIPLLSLYSAKNRDFLQQLIEKNGSTVSAFLTECIFKPFARSFIELLLRGTSIEGHGQNLLLLLDPLKRVVGLMYRDMGGVSQLFTAAEFRSLPMNLQDPALYYPVENHIGDAAKALEDLFVRRGLFPLTKQLVKMPSLGEVDKRFCDWRAYQLENGYLQNWTTKDFARDDHQERLLAKDFYRYGFAECLFAVCFIEYLQIKKIVSEEEYQRMTDHLFNPEELSDGSVVAPCSYIPFFSTEITRILIGKIITEYRQAIILMVVQLVELEEGSAERTVYVSLFKTYLLASISDASLPALAAKDMEIFNHEDSGYFHDQIVELKQKLQPNDRQAVKEMLKSKSKYLALLGIDVDEIIRDCDRVTLRSATESALVVAGMWYKPGDKADDSVRAAGPALT